LRVRARHPVGHRLLSIRGIAVAAEAYEYWRQVMMAGLLLFFGRYKLVLEIAIIGALVAFGVVQVHRFLEHERDIGRTEVQAKWDNQTALDKDAKAAREAEFAAQLAQATKNGVEREATIRTLAGAAGNSGIGLRDAVAAAVSRSMSSDAVNALRDTTRALGTIVTECEGRRRAVAEDFERANSDKQTLMDAWPRNPDPTTKAKQ
jgi:hypothetical protein